MSVFHLLKLLFKIYIFFKFRNLFAQMYTVIPYLNARAYLAELYVSQPLDK